MKSLLKLFYPDQCSACSGLLTLGENLICTSCRHALPVTHLHTTTHNPIKKLLRGRTSLELATALFYFDKKSRVQQLIHNLKYRNQEHLSTYFGNWLGEELTQLEVYQDVDCIIPVPLHKKRLKKRGYNQVAGFGKAIAHALGKSYSDTVLYRKKATRTQVFLNRGLRSTEVIDSFDVLETESLAGKHILLVDDLITTGGTVEGCAIALQKIPGIKLSVAVMAITD
ncbi:ComF family protein [Leeuwenhoekiella marinoflava]|uniref:ComF family protein n=2 Tax=Leeuwenhoekiella marinoflava TaxID=988 RepID=A0A4Q0P8N3_9FLAO|nr:phosphoribosyltransferase family protein [Leeuwenhoekiella marinoflava]RXG23084.1 ComF family protein [Leeuwenhoekiella marinoflava]SHE29902.1 comF family protein [Leeuwenhoekiella marinoflava DSM 3653]